MSTAFGDAYLLQANNQIELENWVTAIHSGEMGWTKEEGEGRGRGSGRRLSQREEKF